MNVKQVTTESGEVTTQTLGQECIDALIEATVIEPGVYDAEAAGKALLNAFQSVLSGASYGNAEVVRGI